MQHEKLDGMFVLAEGLHFGRCHSDLPAWVVDV